jgi:hypothetical protein
MAAFLTWVFMCFYTELWRKAILLGFVGKIYTFACLLACLPACEKPCRINVLLRMAYFLA